MELKINARELYKELNGKQDFTTWIKKRIEHYDLVEGVDYVLTKVRTQHPNNPKARPQVRHDYYLTSECADLIRTHQTTRVRLCAPVKMEEVALTTIEQVLGVKLQRQFRVYNENGNWYSIDGYCAETNVAYEIDERHHKNPSNEVKDKV
jgi:phage anti-repressor protein